MFLYPPLSITANAVRGGRAGIHHGPSPPSQTSLIYNLPLLPSFQQQPYNSFFYLYKILNGTLKYIYFFLLLIQDPSKMYCVWICVSEFSMSGVNNCKSSDIKNVLAAALPVFPYTSFGHRTYHFCTKLSSKNFDIYIVKVPLK